MMNETKQSKRKIDYIRIYCDLRKHLRLYLIVLPVTFVLTAFIMLSKPNIYTCTVMLSPELSNRSSSLSSLANLASSFGVKLGSGMGSSSEALFPTLYPDLMSSVDFKVSLFNVKVKPEDSDQEYTYYDYLRNVKKHPWWSDVIGGVIGSITELLITDTVKVEPPLNPRRLTKKQNRMAKQLDKTIYCDVDKKTMVITISVKDTDPVVAATMADSAMMLLQNYITDYRTKKARVDMEHYGKMTEEAKECYEQASRAYAQYADANLNSFQEKVRQKKSEMETEVLLQRTVYQQVLGQLKQAEMRVQEDTPAFAVIQPSTIPAKNTGPKRTVTCLFFLFVAFMGTSAYALHKEGDLKMLLGL